MTKEVLLVESMNKDSIMSTVQAENVWDSCFITERKTINFINDMPSNILINGMRFLKIEKNK